MAVRSARTAAGSWIKLELNPETVQLAPLIDEVVGTARQLAQQNKNRLVAFRNGGCHPLCHRNLPLSGLPGQL
jgi:thiazole synthase ThiGH ThiG subunit